MDTLKNDAAAPRTPELLVSVAHLVKTVQFRDRRTLPQYAGLTDLDFAMRVVGSGTQAVRTDLSELHRWEAALWYLSLLI
jgi:hypothetical protein